MEKIPITKVRPTILKDSQEHKGHGFNFRQSDYFAGMEVVSLFDGDYTLRELPPQYFYCDRKETLSELAANFFSKADKDRFKDCLERAKPFKYKFIIVEQDLKDIFYNQSLKHMKMKPEALIRKIIETSLIYNIHFIMAGKMAHTYTLSLLKRIWEQYCQESKVLENEQKVSNN